MYDQQGREKVIFFLRRTSKGVGLALACLIIAGLAAPENLLKALFLENGPAESSHQFLGQAFAGSVESKKADRFANLKTNQQFNQTYATRTDKNRVGKRVEPIDAIPLAQLKKTEANKFSGEPDNNGVTIELAPYHPKGNRIKTAPAPNRPITPNDQDGSASFQKGDPFWAKFLKKRTETKNKKPTDNVETRATPSALKPVRTDNKLPPRPLRPSPGAFFDKPEALTTSGLPTKVKKTPSSSQKFEEPLMSPAKLFRPSRDLPHGATENNTTVQSRQTKTEATETAQRTYRGKKISAFLPSNRPATKTRKAIDIIGLGLSPNALKKLKALEFRITDRTNISFLDVSVVRIQPPKQKDLDSALALLRKKIKGVGWAANHIYHAHENGPSKGVINIGPNEKDQTETMSAPTRRCERDRCYAHAKIKWQPNLAKCSAGLPIGIIDTEIDHLHPAFKGRKIQTSTFGTSERQKHKVAHGTSLLALLAGDPASRTPGLIPDAHYFAADVFHDGDDGLLTSDTFTLIKALDWLDSQDVKLITMGVMGPKDDILQRLVKHLRSKGVTFVAAAGLGEAMTYPAAFPSVISVTAIGPKSQTYRYAATGNHIDIAAPGVGIWTAQPSQQAAYKTGSSFAIPFVTASLATIYRGVEAQTKAKSALDYIKVVDLGEKGPDEHFGRGMLIAPTRCAITPNPTSSNKKERPSGTAALFR